MNYWSANDWFMLVFFLLCALCILFCRWKESRAATDIKAKPDPKPTLTIGQKIILEIGTQRMVRIQKVDEDECSIDILLYWAPNADYQLSALVEEHVQERLQQELDRKI